MNEAYVVDAWYRGAWWLWLLRPLEAVYRSALGLRRALYRHGLLNTHRAGVPVVVVGNITVGGTGKTPVVIALVESLAARGIRAGVVSRGYGAAAIGTPVWVRSDSPARRVGDEPLLIHRRTGCPCVVAKDRTAAVKLLVESECVDIVISDDGLQHLAMGRDMEIALIDADRRLGNRFCLPAGPLREPAARLHSVDVVLYRGGEGPENSVCYQATALVNMHSGEERSISATVPGESVHAVAGIGQPVQFFEGLRALGFAPRQHV